MMSMLFPFAQCFTSSILEYSMVKKSNKQYFFLSLFCNFQMYCQIFPMLSKGSFVYYYGGCKLLKEVPKSGSPVSPAMLGLSILFQVSLYIFKKLKLRKPEPRSPNSCETSLKYAS